MTGNDGREGVRIRSASAKDLEPIRALLRTSGLGADDVAPVTDRFVVAVGPDDTPIGCVALDGGPPELLLRSAAVAPERRGIGLGRLLVEAALLEAAARQAVRVVLVTEGAADFFAGLGFVRIERGEVGEALRDHAQFTGACPASATVMRIELD